jgi:hypothetical protein
MSSRVPALLVALALPIGGATGCGEVADTHGSTHAPPFLATHRVDIVYGDCSSFRGNTEAFVPQMVTIAERSAIEQRVLWAGCFDGAPLRTLHWKPKVDFGDLPRDVRRNATVAKRVDLARALGMRRSFMTMIRTTPRRVRGSGQLEALELAAETKGVGRVFMFTDGIVHQVDGISLNTATRAQIDRTIARWAPRLTGLRGATLLFVGVGRDAYRTAVVRNAKELFRGLAAKVGVARFGWDVELPADFDVTE